MNDAPSPSPAFVRIKDAAKRLSVDQRTIRRWIADGIVPTAKIAGSVYIPERFFHKLEEQAMKGWVSD